MTEHTAASAALQEMSAEHLMRRYRRLLWGVAAPLFGLLLLLTVWQAWQGQQTVLDELERRAAAHQAAVQSAARAAVDHVADLRNQLERDFLSAPHAPDAALGSLLRPHPGAAAGAGANAGAPEGYTLDELPQLLQPGLAQLLWFQPDAVPDDGSLWRLQLIAQTAETAHNRYAELARSYYLGAPEKMLVVYPWVPSSTLIDATGQRSLLAAAPVLARHATFAAGTPASNPSHTSYWTRARPDTSAAADAATETLTETRGSIVSHAAPVYAGEVFRGVVGSDLKLAVLQRTLAALPPGAGHWWLVNDQGDVLLQSAAATTALASRPADFGASAAPQQRPSETLPLPPAALDTALQSAGHAVAVAGQRVVALDVAAAPWTLVFTLSHAEVAAQVLPGLLPFALIGLALLGMFLHGQWLLRKRVIEPALRVMDYLEAKSRNDAAVEPDLGERWQPWVKVISATFRAQREASQRERRSEAFKSAIVDNALAAIIATDGDGHIVEFNPAAEAMFGRSRQSVLGHDVGEVIVPERFRAAHAVDLQHLQQASGAAAPGTLGRRRELQALRADGSEFPVEVVFWRTEVDGETHFTASLFDISARRNLALEIERQREALRQSEKLSAMGNLLAGVAHELNNPLAIVLGRASLLEDKCETHPDLRADASRIREAAERCGRIVRTFLNMARSKPAERRSLSINELVRGAADMLAYTYRSHDIELTLDLVADLPPVDADADQIGQIVLNLMVNAQQLLAASGSIKRQVNISTGVFMAEAKTNGSAYPTQLWVRVADNGVGVDPALREKIFQPFFTTKPEGTGTGIGLAVSRTMAREHGGDLTLQDTPAQDAASLGGAVFVLTLPVAAAGSP